MRRSFAQSAIALGFLLALHPPIAIAATLSPAPTVGSSFNVGTLHVDRYGSGKKSIVLIPGLGCGPWEWYGTIAHLQPHFTVYALTLPGFDGQPATAQRPLFKAFANDFWQLLATHHIVKPIVIGHSLGGTLAIALGEEHPHRLARIIAVDGMPIFPLLAMATPAQREAQANAAAAAYASDTPAQAQQYQLGYMQSIGTIHPSLAPAMAELAAKSDPKAVGSWLKADLGSDLRPKLARITIPLLEIMPYNPADQKPPYVYTQAQTLGFYQSLLAGAPHVTVTPISPSRHFAMIDQPTAFYAILDAALTSQ